MFLILSVIYYVIVCFYNLYISLFVLLVLI